MFLYTLYVSFGNETIMKQLKNLSISLLNINDNDIYIIKK